MENRSFPFSDDEAGRFAKQLVLDYTLRRTEAQNLWDDIQVIVIRRLLLFPLQILPGLFANILIFYRYKKSFANIRGVLGIGF